MFDLGWTEILAVAVLALVVVGPKELPGLLRTIGKWVSKGRRIVNDLRREVDDMVNESGVGEVRDSLHQVSSMRIDDEVKKAVDPDGSMKKELETGLKEDPFEPADASDRPQTDAEIKAKEADSQPETQPEPGPEPDSEETNQTASTRRPRVKTPAPSEQEKA